MHGPPQSQPSDLPCEIPSASTEPAQSAAAAHPGRLLAQQQPPPPLLLRSALGAAPTAAVVPFLGMQAGLF